MGVNFPEVESCVAVCCRAFESEVTVQVTYRFDKEAHVVRGLCSDNVQRVFRCRRADAQTKEGVYCKIGLEEVGPAAVDEAELDVVKGCRATNPAVVRQRDEVEVLGFNVGLCLGPRDKPVRLHLCYHDIEQPLHKTLKPPSLNGQ
ncbi:hypothetical protein ES703_76176 [subsurface metagenome]